MLIKRGIQKTFVSFVMQANPPQAGTHRYLQKKANLERDFFTLVKSSLETGQLTWIPFKLIGGDLFGVSQTY